MREQTFMQQAHAQMDDFLDRGAEVLRGSASSATAQERQRRLYSVGTTLGISGAQMRMVRGGRGRTSGYFGWSGGVFRVLLLCARWLR